ncbi:MAG: hypothetical protein ACK55O_03705 [Phycisphaerales bacterium]|nr:hypothetical protein [Phycisphaeraceae bacterium]
MSVLPTKIEQFLTFLNERSETWADNSQALNLGPQVITEFQGLLSTANVAFDAAGKARNTAKASVDAQTVALSNVRKSAANIIRQVRLTADRSATPENIYILAQLPVPQPPSPRPAPEAPTELRASLNAATGELTVRWKARQQAEVVYFVTRATISASGTVGPAELVGTVGGKKFTDEDLPAGAAGFQYTVRAQRGRVPGEPSSTLVVRLSGGGMTQSIINARGKDVRIAA